MPYNTITWRIKTKTFEQHHRIGPSCVSDIFKSAVPPPLHFHIQLVCPSLMRESTIQYIITLAHIILHVYILYAWCSTSERRIQPCITILCTTAVNKPPSVSILPPRLPIIFDVSAVFQSRYRRRLELVFFPTVSVRRWRASFYLHYNIVDTTAVGSSQLLLLLLLLWRRRRRSIRDNKLHSIIIILLRTLILFHPRVHHPSYRLRVTVFLVPARSVSLFHSFRHAIDL